MNRVNIISLVLSVMVLAGIAPQASWATDIPAVPKLEAKSWRLEDFNTAQVLAESNSDLQIEPASLTKLMTTYVVFSEIRAGRVRLDDKVRVSERAWRMQGSRMFIEVGSEVTVDELLHGVIVQSGNDASVALAEHVAGDENAFVELMNQYASRLGLLGSHFANASGLPHEGHLTTARDMVAIARALILEFPEHYPVHSLEDYTFNGIKQRNRNGLLFTDSSVDGLKTGHTEAAGYCLVASAERDGMRLISVVTGTSSSRAREEQTQSLLNFGFRFYETHKVYEAFAPIKMVRIWHGDTDQLPLGLATPLFITVPRGQYQNLQAQVEVSEDMRAPVTRGDQRGIFKVKLDDRVILERPMVALATVEKGNLWQQLKDSVRSWIQ